MTDAKPVTPTMDAKEAARLCAKIRAKAADLADLIRQLRDGAGWVPLGYATWEACCKEEFGYSKRHANRLIQSQQIIEQVGPMGPASPNERQARELARLPEDDRADCWESYLSDCEGMGEKATAKGLREQVDAWLHVAAEEQAKPTPAFTCPNCGSHDRAEDDLGTCCAKCKEPLGDTPTKPVAPTKRKQRTPQGVILANEALNVLMRIPRNDPLRARGFEIVMDWIESNK